MTTLTLEENISRRLEEVFGSGEARSIARIVSEFLRERYNSPSSYIIDEYLERIIKGEPVQYVVGHTWFYDLKLSVDSRALIPRPETEELADWIIRDWKDKQGSLKVIDIGTGSGCLAVVIAKHLRSATVSAVDISLDAIELAGVNAALTGVEISLSNLDILSTELSGDYDIIVSNPPYISHEETEELSIHVLEHEPHAALSPGGPDPLIFYKKFAEIGRARLAPGGCMYLELSEFRAHDIHGGFIQAGFKTDIRKDMQDKWRMLKCWV